MTQFNSSFYDLIERNFELNCGKITGSIKAEYYHAVEDCRKELRHPFQRCQVLWRKRNCFCVRILTGRTGKKDLHCNLAD